MADAQVAREFRTVANALVLAKELVRADPQDCIALLDDQVAKLEELAKRLERNWR